MKLGGLLASILLWIGAFPINTQAEDASGILTIDQIFSITSVIGGSPQWSPDGESILLTSSFAGGLATISPDGGFPVRVPIEMGGTGRFQMPPEWSPKGRWISYISNKGGSSEIWLWSTEDGRELRLTNLGARISSMSWSPDEQWIAFAGDRFGNYDIWKASVPDGKVHRLTDDKRYDVFPTWTPDANSIVYVRLDETWADHDVIVMDEVGGNARTVVSDSDFFDLRAGARFGYPRVSPKGDKVLFPSHRSGWINYWTVPLAGGEPRPMASADADQHEARWSPDGKSIAYIENHNGQHDLRVVSSAGGKPKVVVSPAMGSVSSPDWSPDGLSILFKMDTVTRPADLYVVSLASEAGGSEEPRQLTQSMPAGNYESRLVVPEKIRYPSSDGYTISAYLFRPPNLAPGTRVPGIVWLHGGPTGQFSDMFETFGPGGSRDAQFFAMRGYAVLLPNFRGSSGYGKTFEDANNGCWGHCDLEDVVAGVEYLKSLPYIDGTKMGVTGTSYGGILSMTAVAFAPDLFQAAIPASGWADWLHYYHGENELGNIKLLEYELGLLPDSEETWRRCSAIRSAADVSTPVFLVHGQGLYPGSDQSELFARELRNHNKTFRYKTYEGETYYVFGKANRKQLALDMLDFFDQFLKD